MHKDLNVTRAIVYKNKLEAAKFKHVDDVFSTVQLHLQPLATHPEYQRRGAGT